jgi:hypothetical protein
MSARYGHLSSDHKFSVIERITQTVTSSTGTATEMPTAFRTAIRAKGQAFSGSLELF